MRRDTPGRPAGRTHKPCRPGVGLGAAGLPQPVVYRSLQNRVDKLIAAPRREDMRPHQLIDRGGGCRRLDVCQGRRVGRRGGAENRERRGHALRILAQTRQTREYPAHDALGGEALHSRSVSRAATRSLRDEAAKQLPEEKWVATGRAVAGAHELLVRVEQPVLLDQSSHVGLGQRAETQSRRSGQ